MSRLFLCVSQVFFDQRQIPAVTLFVILLLTKSILRKKFDTKLRYRWFAA